MSSVRKLWDMQQLDMQQLEKQKSIKESSVPQKLNILKNEVTAGVVEFKKQKEDYKLLKMAITELEDQASELKVKIKNLNAKLNDGTVPNHKEMALMFDEVQQLQQRIADIETEELLLIEQQEYMKLDLEQKSEYLKARKALYDQLKADYQALKQDLQQQLQQIISDKEKLVTIIADDYLQLYRELLKRYLNPVAIAKDGVCCGCHLKLNASQRQQLKTGQEIIKCDHCGRLIFIPEDSIDLA